MSSLTIATNSQKLDLQIHFERLIYNISSEPRHVLIPFKQYGCPKKSTQIIFLQHFQKQFQYFQYFLVSRSNFRCNSFPKSAFSSDLGLSKSNIFVLSVPTMKREGVGDQQSKLTITQANGIPKYNLGSALNILTKKNL